MTRAIWPAWQRFRRLTWLVCLTFVLPLAGLAQTRAPAPTILSIEAQTALQKGLAAAKEQKWESAIQSFQDARRSAPDAPDIYYDLGLAESNIPGRELRALAWFSAYLVANPNAPNAAAISDKMMELDKVVRSNTTRLIKAAQDAALQTSRVSQAGNLMDVVDLWAYAGDYSAGLKTADLIQDADYKNGAQINIVYAQARDGDIVGARHTLELAQKTASLIRDADGKSSAETRYMHAVSSIEQAPKDIAADAERLKHFSPHDHLTWLLGSLDGSFNRPQIANLTGYLKSLPPSDDPQKVFDALAKAAMEVVLAQNSMSDWPKRVK